MRPVIHISDAQSDAQVASKQEKRKPVNSTAVA